MMGTRRVYFTCCLLLLIFAATLFLLGGYAAKRESIQLGDRHFLVLASSFLLSVSILPILIAFSIACGGLGCIQDRIALREILKRILAYLFMAGILFAGVGAYVRGRAVRDDYYRVFDEARWVGFLGLIFLALPVLFHLYGFGRHAFRESVENRVQQPLTVSEEKSMKAAKLYALGGLLLILSVLLRAFWSGWPWQEERVAGLSAAMAGLFTWPLGAALGTAALFLSVLQSLVAIHERIKLTAGITYFVGASLFLSSLYADLLREQPWDVPIRWPTATGLSLLLAVFLLNLVGMLRHQEQPARDVPLETD